MNILLIALIFLLLPQRPQSAWAQTPAGDPEAGKAVWAEGNTSCRNCHGGEGQGAFGPVLAGRGLTFDEFKTAVRMPKAKMPSYAESQLNDREIADLAAYFRGLPALEKAGPWRFDLTADASPAQELVIATIGCAQCHTPTLDTPRRLAGATGGDFEWFKRQVYDHPESSRVDQARGLGLRTDAKSRVRMGTYSPSRVTEPMLKQIWSYMGELGHRVNVIGQLSAGAPGADGVSYTLTLQNRSLPRKGLTAEDLMISLRIPADSTVVKATGTGYQGVRRDEQAKAMVAVWQVPKIAPQETPKYTITLSQAATSADNLRGTIRWTKPAIKDGPSVANIAPAPLARQ